MLPDIGEDPLRAVSRLPGVARQDYSSRIHLRGGTDEETLVRFDDLRLYDPFHFKDFYGVFSAIDPGIVSDMRVYTGGFPGDIRRSQQRRRGIAPRLPGQQFQGQAVLSLFTAGLSVDGSFDDGAGDWAAAARRSNMGLFFDLANSPLGEPDYHDFFGHVGRRINDWFAISANAADCSSTRSWRSTATRKRRHSRRVPRSAITGCAWTSVRRTVSAAACSSHVRSSTASARARRNFPASRPAPWKMSGLRDQLDPGRWLVAAGRALGIAGRRRVAADERELPATTTRLISSCCS